ncbi:hypothetical protein QPK87_06160 [Kamptonema cortianum]|nr:hypothetical protein [Geitlerinema splendidum]MDK3156158.1 hypothetical protein [Kamptonema cortianum]
MAISLPDNFVRHMAVRRTNSSRARSQRVVKYCPLCGCANLPNDVDCYVCGWHGAFDRYEIVVEESTEAKKSVGKAVVDKCSSVPVVLIEGFWRMKDWCRKVFRRQFDIRA